MTTIISCLSSDNINNILDFILNNKDMCNFRKTCKYFQHITNQYGYIREIISFHDS